MTHQSIRDGKQTRLSGASLSSLGARHIIPCLTPHNQTCIDRLSVRHAPQHGHLHHSTNYLLFFFVCCQMPSQPEGMVSNITSLHWTLYL